MITTKRGDDGQTDCGGKRVSKDSLLVEVIGEIDELQAVLELIGQNPSIPTKVGTPPLDKGGIIKDLGVIMGVLGSQIVRPACRRAGVRSQENDLKYQVEKMENEIEKNQINLNKFVVFMKKKAKELNWARTVCRRVERRVVALSKTQIIDKEILKYFNRLSDYLFTMALKNN